MKYIVRLYDGFDNIWMDVSGKVSLKKAQKIWRDKTKNGTKNVSFNCIDYYMIFPTDTKMLFSYENKTHKKRLKESQ